MQKMQIRAANKKIKGVTTFLSGVCLYMWIFGTRAYIVVCRDLVKQGEVVSKIWCMRFLVRYVGQKRAGEISL